MTRARYWGGLTDAPRHLLPALERDSDGRGLRLVTARKRSSSESRRCRGRAADARWRRP